MTESTPTTGGGSPDRPQQVPAAVQPAAGQRPPEAAPRAPEAAQRPPAEDEPGSPSAAHQNPPAAEPNRLAALARTAADTARTVPGVHALGGLVARAADQVRDRLGTGAGTNGVRIEDLGDHLIVNVAIVTDYPVQITGVANDVRAAITVALSGASTGRAGDTATAVSVDVHVLGINDPSDTSDADEVTGVGGGSTSA